MERLPNCYRCGNQPCTCKDGITLYHADCRDVLPLLEPGSVDLVLTDPPYGIGHDTRYASRNRGRNAKTHDWPEVRGDDQPFDPLPFLQWPAVLWGANYYAGKLPCSSGWLVWDKRTRNDKGTNDQADGELAWTNCIKGIRIFRHMWNGYWRESEKGCSWHPMQKPAALMRWALKRAPDGAVFDPYAGCGPVGRACKDLGRKCIMVEIEEKYVRIAANRLRQEVLFR